MGEASPAHGAEEGSAARKRRPTTVVGRVRRIRLPRWAPRPSDKPWNLTRGTGALAERERVEMPMQKTFGSPAFGGFGDRFDIPWEISGMSTDPAK